MSVDLPTFGRPTTSDAQFRIARIVVLQFGPARVVRSYSSSTSSIIAVDAIAVRGRYRHRLTHDPAREIRSPATCP